MSARNHAGDGPRCGSRRRRGARPRGSMWRAPMPADQQATQVRRVVMFAVLPAMALMTVFYLAVLRPVWSQWDAERAACEAKAGKVWVQSRTGGTACVTGERLP